jgi:hypothetical protein
VKDKPNAKISGTMINSVISDSVGSAINHPVLLAEVSFD